MDIQIDQIQNMIYVIRGQKVMLDSDLAQLYGVETKVLNQAVKRNIKRFPADFLLAIKCILESRKCPDSSRSRKVFPTSPVAPTIAILFALIITLSLFVIKLLVPFL